MIVFFALLLTLPTMSAFAWFTLLVANPAALRQIWLYIAALRLGVICGLLAAVFLYTPLWSIAFGPDADDWRDYCGFVLAFNVIGVTVNTLGAWAVSLLLRWPTRVSGEVAQPGKSYYRVD